MQNNSLRTYQTRPSYIVSFHQPFSLGLLSICLTCGVIDSRDELTWISDDYIVFCLEAIFFRYSLNIGILGVSPPSGIYVSRLSLSVE
jgi:hypothetical protein